jgi:hypothetical protein
LTGIVRVDLSEFELDLAVDVHIREQDEAAAQRSAAASVDRRRCRRY